MKNEDTNKLETPFIDFTSDYGFKATFGNESDTRFLRRALQALIKSDIPIEKIEFIKTDFQALNLGSRSGVYDLACIDEAKNQFIVEMQANDYPHFIQRMKFYALHKFNIMVKKGKYIFDDLTPIYCIGILSNSIYTSHEYYSYGQLKSETGEVMDNLLTYITVELDKFHKPLNKITTDLEKLIFTMKNLQTYTEQPTTEVPAFWTEEWLQIAIEELDTRRFTAEEYEQHVITIVKNASVIQQDRIKILKARKEEREDNEIKAVIGFHGIAVSNENIAKALDIPIQKVVEIIENNRPKI